MTPDEAIAALQPWIERHEKPAWRPVIEEGDGGVAASKFGGIPWLAADEEWPVCKACNHPLEVFLQLNLAELPSELDGRFGTGLLQLFYCSRAGGECHGEPGWEPFSDVCSRVRIVSPQGNAGVTETKNQFEAKRIVGWEQFVDRPDPGEHGELGIDINYHFKTVPYTPAEMTCPELGLHFSGMNYINKLHESVQSESGDKLAGWPHWVQGVEYPACPKCKKPMRYVFQIDSENNIPFMFGDCGVGHITQCETHKEVVAFGWACG